MVRISEIVNQNPWWKRGRDFSLYDQNLQKAEPIFFKRRDIDLRKGNIYILRGPRQVGKTTFLKSSIKNLLELSIPPKNILYLSLDFFTSRREMRNAIEYFLDSTRDADQIYLFIDEITSLADWNLELKFLADQGIMKKGVILATGSSAVKLKEKGEMLPGRGLEGNEYYLKPLSFREFVIQLADAITEHLPPGEFKDGFKRLTPVLKECFIDLSYGPEGIKKEIQKVLPFKKELGYLFGIYLITGGLPGVINHYFSNRYLKGKETIEPQISEIFIRDVLGDLSRLQKQEPIARQILRAIVERYCSRYTFTKLSRDVERTHITIIDYLEFLEESFICFILYAYDFNKKEPKWKGDKKVYFFDPMVFHSMKSFLRGEEIWDIITASLEDEEVQSKVIEGIVISHFIRHRELPLLKPSKTFLWSYYDKSGKEIDAIFKENDTYLGIEVKYRSDVSKVKIKDINLIKKFIVLSKEDVGGRGKAVIAPVDIFLALLPSSKKNL